MTHPCDTCGGTGEEMHPLYWTRKEWHTRVYTGKAPRCPVCLGAGSFPDRMPAADALADAETLCNVAQALTWESNAFASRIMNARTEAIRSARGLDGASAARAAFRAVPGLKTSMRQQTGKPIRPKITVQGRDANGRIIRREFATREGFERWSQVNGQRVEVTYVSIPQCLGGEQ